MAYHGRSDDSTDESIIGVCLGSVSDVSNVEHLTGFLKSNIRYGRLGSIQLTGYLNGCTIRWSDGFSYRSLEQGHVCM